MYIFMFWVENILFIEILLQGRTAWAAINIRALTLKTHWGVPLFLRRHLSQAMRNCGSHRYHNNTLAQLTISLQSTSNPSSTPAAKVSCHKNKAEQVIPPKEPGTFPCSRGTGPDPYAGLSFGHLWPLLPWNPTPGHAELLVALAALPTCNSAQPLSLTKCWSLCPSFNIT